MNKKNNNLHFSVVLLQCVFTKLFSLTFSTSCANSADDELVNFFLYSKKTSFVISCKLSPVGTICMKCQVPFSRKNKKNILKCHLLKFLSRVLKINL